MRQTIYLFSADQFNLFDENPFTTSILMAKNPGNLIYTAMEGSI
ncbi:MAG: hypothetical protein ACOZFS_10795 [Thermodesulfobacteriota bacterium]